MCGRFYMDESTMKKIKKLVARIERDMEKYDYNGDIYPTNSTPLIILKDKEMVIEDKIWGYPHFKNKGVIINARSETVLEKKMFKNGIKGKRCIIPAAHFYEWNKNKEKISLSRKDHCPVFMAGFYDNFMGEDRFVMLTTEANDSMIKIHHRMPLILEREHIEDYLLDDSKLKEFLSLLPTDLEAHYQMEQQTMF